MERIICYHQNKAPGRQHRPQLHWANVSSATTTTHTVPSAGTYAYKSLLWGHRAAARAYWPHTQPFADPNHADTSIAPTSDLTPNHELPTFLQCCHQLTPQCQTHLQLLHLSTSPWWGSKHCTHVLLQNPPPSLHPSPIPFSNPTGIVASQWEWLPQPKPCQTASLQQLEELLQLVPEHLSAAMKGLLHLLGLINWLILPH